MADYPNWANRTVWTGDNLDILRGKNSESVDLIYADPPFNSNRTYSAPIGSQAAGAAFKDTWTLEDVDVAWHGEIADREPALYSVIEAAGVAHGTGMKSYLIMMGVRMLEMRRVLKATGSIYLHCDPTANSYLRLLMDAILGRRTFRNEITWRRVNPTGRASKRYANNSDSILYYAGAGFTWNQQYGPHNETYVKKAYRHRDPNGRRYRLDNLKGAGTRNGSSGEPWRGIDPGETGSHWAVPGGALPPEAKGMATQEKLDLLDSMGRIYWPPRGRIPSYKRYLDEMPGTAIDTIWTDIGNIQSASKERVGYPTQKPLKLLDRIIRASSDEGDVVLDPFCGCATALVAAETLGREWAGIDLSPLAVKLVDQRLRDQHGLFGQITARTDCPQRTDVGELPNYRTHKHTLFGKQEGVCNGCLTFFPFRNFTVDHIVPQSRGGTDHPDNLQLLCGACNSKKGNRPMASLIAELVKSGIRPVSAPSS